MHATRHAPLILSILVLGLAGCFGSDDLPPVEHSPGFFAEFDRTVETATSAAGADRQAARLRIGFSEALEEGPGAGETSCVGPVWDKVALFLEVGMRSADVMADVQGAEANEVEIYEAAADRVLRSDVAAISRWNETVVEMGRPEARIQPTGPLAWASLDLVLAASEHAEVQQWIESGEWVEGHWERLPGYYEDVWVPGYYETVWQEGSCWDQYIGSDCDTFWVEETCDSYYVESGYWESYCAEHDDWGACVYWDEHWVDTGYWDTYCTPGYWLDECRDVYETVCEDGQYVDVWIDGYMTQGPWIPGEDVWIEGYWRDTSGYQSVLLVEQEARILSRGVAIVLASEPEALGAGCEAGLIAALEDGSGPVLREAVMACLGPELP